MSVKCRVDSCVYKTGNEKCVLKQIEIGPDGLCQDHLFADLNFVRPVNHLNYFGEKGVYCRMLHKIINDFCCCMRCPLPAGSLQGEGVECFWDDVEVSYYQAPTRYTPKKEWARVDNLIKNGVLSRNPSREGVVYSAEDFFAGQ